jgi:hypothetical protein
VVDALDIWQRVLELSREMCDLARRAEWDDLVLREEERDRVLQQASVQAGSGLNAGQESQRQEIIRQILACDEETRDLTRSWMSELRELMDSEGVKKKLDQFYGGGQ